MRRYLKPWILFLCWIPLSVGCRETPPPAPEAGHGHSHADESTTVTEWTEKSELFFEYPTLVAGRMSAGWAVHLTRLSDFSPVTEGVLTLAFRAPDGTVYTTVAEAPSRPGIFLLTAQLPTPGSYDLRVVIEGPQLQDRIAAPPVEVLAAGEQPAPTAHADQETTSFLKEQQWSIDFATAAVVEHRIPDILEVNGDIVAAADRIAEPASPVSGLVRSQTIPVVGDRVRAGQTLVRLSPTAERGSYAGAKADVERLTREVERLTRLHDAEAVAEKRVIEARHDLELAEVTLAAMVGAGGGGYTYTLKAPISGVIQNRYFNPGARVEAGATLFSIIDPEEVWLRLNVPARYASAVGRIEAAEASDARAVFTVEGAERIYRTDRWVAAANAIDPETRTLALHLGVTNTDHSLRIGQWARARLPIGQPRSGPAIPNGAIQRQDGRPVAYVQVDGESFVRRDLTLGPNNGELTLVEQGLEIGERVVTVGAYQVYLASLSTNEIGDHGHAH